MGFASKLPFLSCQKVVSKTQNSKSTTCDSFPLIMSHTMYENGQDGNIQVNKCTINQNKPSNLVLKCQHCSAFNYYSTTL